MKKYLLISLFFGATNLFAQQQQDSTLVQSIKSLETKVNQQQNDIQILYSELNKEYRTYRIVREDLNQKIITKQEEVIDSLNTLIEISNQQLKLINEKLNSKIQETEQKADTKIAQLNSSMGKNRLYWIIATLLMLLLGGLVFWLLGKRIKSSQSDVETQIRNAKKSLEEESLKLDGELVKIFQKQLEVLENTPKGATKDEDHSLVLKIADRLTSMETNHYRMDPNTRGLKQLKNAVKSIKENYLAKGYEIVEMLELEYKEGMNVTANFIPSDKIEKGKRIITRVIKPQVNFNGKMIQAAQIEVSIGE